MARSAFLGKNMRFHKSESAFFVFIALVLAGCIALLYAYDVLRTGRELATAAERAAAATYLSGILFGTAMMLAAAVPGSFAGKHRP